MSDTSSDPAAKQRFTALVASALLTALGKPQWAGRRLMLRGLHGLGVSDLLPALLNGPTVDVTVWPDGPSGAPRELKAAQLDDGTALIPYLVDHSALEANRGGVGFAAALRTHFLVGAPQPRVLLILDEQPPETVFSAADDAAELMELSWAVLARKTAIADGAAVSVLVREVAEDFLARSADEGSTTWQDAAHLGSWVEKHRQSSNETVGLALCDLKFYIADDRPSVRRLDKCAMWRRDLGEWVASPAQNVARNLSKKHVSKSGADKVLRAYGLRGLDYHAFTLGDLTAGGPEVPLALDALRLGEGDSRLSLLQGQNLAVWLPADGGSLHLTLTRTPYQGEAVRVLWQSGDSTDFSVTGRRAISNIQPPVQRRWLFGTIELGTADGASQQVYLALYFGDNTVAGFERSLLIDVGAGGFICGEQPQIGVWQAGGKELGDATLAEAGTANGQVDGPQEVFGTWRGHQVGPVPVLPRAAEVADDDGTLDGLADELGSGGEPGPVVDEDDEADEGLAGTEDEEADPLLGRRLVGRGERVPAGGDQPTFAHAMLAFRDAEWPENPGILEPTATGPQRLITAHYGATRLTIQPQLDDVSLLPAEQLILQNAHGTAYRIEPGSIEVLAVLPAPEPRWHQELEQFAAARLAFFALAAEAGSVYALDPRSKEAWDYTSAYQLLLDALPRSGNSRTEYDQLLLIDTAEITGTSDLLVAPTNPLSIAFYRALTERFADLVASDGVDRADIAAFSPQHLLPLLMKDNSWFESVPSPQAFLWRRYSPLADSSPGALERNGSFIAGRIAFFLDVHPGLNHPDATLAVSFVSSGGAPVVEALRGFYTKDLARSAYTRPKLQVILEGGSRSSLRAIGDLAASARTDALDRLVCTRSAIMRREEDHVSPPEGDFSHLAFLFRSPGERKVLPVPLSDRARTTYARGLATSLGRVRRDDADLVFATGVFSPEPGDDASVLERIQYRCLEIVGGSGGENLIPGQTRMVTVRTSERAFSEWYDKAAWVVHLDRLVGLEAFIPEGASQRTVLEYEEGVDPATFGYDGITGTTFVGPYIAALRKALDGLATPDADQARSLMSLLESVSGRWALQIVQRPQNKVLERAGTACAIRFAETVEQALDHASGVRAVVSLEELIPSFPQAGIPRRLAATRLQRGAMCDDLLLVCLVPRGDEPPMVQLTVAEIKFWSETPDYSQAAAQIEESIQWLSARFSDPGRLKDLRGRELADLVRSALERNTAFGLADQPQDHEHLLGRIASGDYELGFGHWRNGDYRRGLVISVERNSPGNLSVTPLIGTQGPVDVVQIRRDAVRLALQGDAIVPPASWSRLSPLPPAHFEGQETGDLDGPQTPASDQSSGPQVGGDPAADATGADDARHEGAADATVAHGEEVALVAHRLDDAFAKYGLTVEPFDPSLAQLGPSVLRLRTRTLGKLSITEIERRARDISREVASVGEVAVGHEPGYITIDVPRESRRPVPLADVLGALDRSTKPGALPFVAGVAPSGAVRVADLSRLPHLLVAGATGSGKSVFLRGLLVELLRARTPEQLQLVIVDPKRLDFAPFTKAPHLRDGKIISNPDAALFSLRATLESELEARQPILERAGVSSAAEFYESGGSLEELPQLVIVVDEFADLVLAGSDRKAFSELIQRYAQLTRAYGIFLVLATQRPSVDVITGSIKANLSARIAFSLPSGRDSMTVLDQGGAENLLGDGDLLFYRNGKVERLQAPFANLADVRTVLG